MENLLIKRHGYGKAIFKEIGVTYEGNFFDNSMSGYGIAKWRNVATYEGQWKLSEPYGCLLYTSKSPRDATLSAMGSCA